MEEQFPARQIFHSEQCGGLSHAGSFSASETAHGYTIAVHREEMEFPRQWLPSREQCQGMAHPATVPASERASEPGISDHWQNLKEESDDSQACLPGYQGMTPQWVPPLYLQGGTRNAGGMCSSGRMRMGAEQACKLTALTESLVHCIATGIQTTCSSPDQAAAIAWGTKCMAGWLSLLTQQSSKVLLKCIAASLALGAATLGWEQSPASSAGICKHLLVCHSFVDAYITVHMDNDQASESAGYPSHAEGLHLGPEEPLRPGRSAFRMSHTNAAMSDGPHSGPEAVQTCPHLPEHEQLEQSHQKSFPPQRHSLLRCVDALGSSCTAAVLEEAEEPVLESGISCAQEQGDQLAGNSVPWMEEIGLKSLIPRQITSCRFRLIRSKPAAAQQVIDNLCCFVATDTLKPFLAGPTSALTSQLSCACP